MYFTAAPSDKSDGDPKGLKSSGEMNSPSGEVLPAAKRSDAPCGAGIEAVKKGLLCKEQALWCVSGEN